MYCNTQVFFYLHAEFDECSSHPCLNGGTCTDGVNNYTCTCPSPYFGKQCQGVAMTCFVYFCEISLLAKHCNKRQFVKERSKCSPDRIRKSGPTKGNHFMAKLHLSFISISSIKLLVTRRKMLKNATFRYSKVSTALENKFLKKLLLQFLLGGSKKPCTALLSSPLSPGQYLFRNCRTQKYATF